MDSNKLLRCCFWLWLLLLAVSCSERPITLWRDYQSYLGRGDLERARDLLERHRDQLLADPLLAAMELGALAFYEQKWTEASLEFERAFQLLNQRRTRLTQYLSKQIISRESEDYLPSPLEYSYLHYFQVLSFWKQYEQSRRSEDLFRARAVLVKWYQYLSMLKDQAPKESTYRQDFFAPYLASLIHQHIGSGSDGEIALQLSLDALQLFPVDKKDKVTRELLLSNYLRLLKKYRSPQELKTALATYSLKELPSAAQGPQQRILFYHRGLVPPKVAVPLGFSLLGARETDGLSSAQMTVMSQAGFLSFATNMLAIAGLIYRGSSSTAVRRQWPGAIQGMLVVSNGLYYEVATRDDLAVPLPQVPVGAQSLRSLRALAKVETDWEAERDILTSGLRFLTKHLIALVASYSLVAKDWGKSAEERQAQSGSSGLLFLSAVGSYMAAAQLINWSERADLRCWHGLFSDIDVVQGEVGAQGPGFFFPGLMSSAASD